MIEIITKAGYTLRINPDYTEVSIGGKTRRFIGSNHRRHAVEYVIRAV